VATATFPPNSVKIGSVVFG